MEAGKAAMSGVFSYIMGPGLIPQLLLTVVALVVFYSVVTAIETVVDGIKAFDRQTTVLMADTTNSQQMILQKPNSGSPMIYPSNNEVNGMEFSYSMWIYINPETFEQRAAIPSSCKAAGNTATPASDAVRLKHIFHKGNKDGWPLMAPGLYCLGDRNTLRLYMNSLIKPENYVDIPNIPIGKWFHLVIVLKGKYLDVYINGNVAVRHEFNTVPKLNYGNIYVMMPIKTATENFNLDGAAKGMVSRLKYYAYAVTYADIDSLEREGPSKKIISNTFTEIPPYFHDDWWVTRY